MACITTITNITTTITDAQAGIALCNDGPMRVFGHGTTTITRPADSWPRLVLTIAQWRCSYLPRHSTCVPG